MIRHEGTPSEDPLGSGATPEANGGFSASRTRNASGAGGPSGDGRSSGGSGSREPDYELRDVEFRRVAIAGAVLIVGSLLAMIAMAFLFKYFAAREAKDQPPRSSFTSPRTPEQPPEPRLQVTPFADLRVLREAQNGELHSYGWIDRKNGIVRVPIDRAEEMIVAKGLPVWAPPGNAAAQADGGGAAKPAGDSSSAERAQPEAGAGPAGESGPADRAKRANAARRAKSSIKRGTGL
jgi:hypothetical protein